MKSRREILQAHYIRIFKKSLNWVGLTSIILTSMIAMPASATAGVLGTRSATMNNSAGGATGVTTTFLVTPGTSATILSVKFSLCTSPLASVGCSSPSGATLAAATAGSQLKNGSAIGAAYGSPTYTSTTDVCFTGSGNAFNGSSDTFTFPVQVISLPTAVNTQFYFREQTYTAASCASGATDFGGFAESTTQILSETANVQENLVFAVGNAGTTCANITGTSITLSPNPMGTGAPSVGTGKMCANTNATSGYAITYNATGFTGTAGTIAPFPTSGTSNASVPGSEQFGFNLKTNTTPAQGANPSGGTGTCTGVNGSIYCTADSYAYNTTGATLLANSAGTPSTDTVYTMSYVANVSITTKPGTYTATQTFICTGTF